MILFIISRLKFDFARLKSYYRGVVAVHNYEGPNWSRLGHREWLKNIDVLLTYCARQLADKGLARYGRR